MTGNASDLRDLGKSGDVPEGFGMPCYLKHVTRRVAVARIGGRLYTSGDLSSTDGAPLSSGRLNGTRINPPCDGAWCDFASEKAAGGSATRNLRPWETREAMGIIQVRIG